MEKLSQLYIRIHNGIAVFHPMDRENLLQSFPEVDLENPETSPIRFEKARMIPHPAQNIQSEFKVWQEEPYEFDGSLWVNSWSKRDMTLKEKYEAEISMELEIKREKQINKYLESVGISPDSPQDVIFDALNKVGPDYVFSLDVD